MLCHTEDFIDTSLGKLRIIVNRMSDVFAESKLNTRSCMMYNTVGHVKVALFSILKVLLRFHM